MFDIDLLLTMTIIASSIVTFSFFINLQRDYSHTIAVADYYEDEDLTITHIDSSIVKESDFK